MEIITVVLSILSIIVSIVSLMISGGLFQTNINTRNVKVTMDSISRLFSSENQNDPNYVSLSACNYADRDILLLIRGGRIVKGSKCVRIVKQNVELQAHKEQEIKIQTRIDYDYDKNSKNFNGYLIIGRYIPKILRFRDLKDVSNTTNIC